LWHFFIKRNKFVFKKFLKDWREYFYSIYKFKLNGLDYKHSQVKYLLNVTWGKDLWLDINLCVSVGVCLSTICPSTPTVKSCSLFTFYSFCFTSDNIKLFPSLLPQPDYSIVLSACDVVIYLIVCIISFYLLILP